MTFISPFDDAYIRIVLFSIGKDKKKSRNLQEISGEKLKNDMMGIMMGIIWRMKVWEIKMSSPLPSDEDKRDLILNEMSQRLNLETNFPAGSSISSGDVSSPDNFFIPSLIFATVDIQQILLAKL